jgi:glycosyltransferase involved in cell wall biosynthesis
VYLRAVPEPEIAAQLQSSLPATLPGGTRTSIFCMGIASVDGQPVSSVELLVDGRAHPARAVAMPRFDTTPRRCGFWAVVPIHANEPAVSLRIRVTDAAGRGFERPLAEIAVTAGSGQPATGPAAREGLIAVCLATCNPPPRLFEAQLDSLRAQTDDRWTCVISDDASDPDSYAALLEAVGDDPRFSVTRSEKRLGFYRNFERALTLVPADAALVALCDQDDVWHPDKLAVLRAAIGSAGVAYSDMRLVDEQGQVLRDTLWSGRANNPDSLASLLMAGSITGAAMMLTSEIVARSLPFPDSPGIEFHDHWLSLVGLACGQVAYVPRPLYDYVQHAGAVVGKHSGASLGRDWRSAVRMREWRAAYFLGYVPGLVRAVALLERCGDRLTPGKRRALERYIACERSMLALGWLLARPLRSLWGRNETLGSEWELTRGVVWRWAAGWVARRPRWPDRLLLDSRFPDPPLWRQRRLQRWRSEV